MSSKAGRYQLARYAVYFFNLAETAIILWTLFQLDIIARFLNSWDGPPQLFQVFGSVCLIQAVIALIQFPQNAYIGFFHEKKFKLSNETFRSWLADHLKAWVLLLAVQTVMFGVFYEIVWVRPTTAWLELSLYWLAGAMVIAYVLPHWILPLFYPMKPMQDGPLKQELFKAIHAMRIKLSDIYEMKLSRKSKKVNAFVVGLGRTHRVVLTDTLIKNFEPDEIRCVLCHELGHFVKQHVLKGLGMRFLMVLLGLFVLMRLDSVFGRILPVEGIGDLRLYPLLLLALILSNFSVQPVLNAVSRDFEKDADRYALTHTSSKKAFVRTMQKLAEYNLAFLKPHPLLVFWFYSHPPIPKRIQLAKESDLV